MNIDHALPGAELIEAGIASLRQGRLDTAGLLLLIARSRLEEAGIEVPAITNPPNDPNLALYERLAASEPDAAHSRYNALLRQLNSFLAAAERAQGARTRG